MQLYHLRIHHSKLRGRSIVESQPPNHTRHSACRVREAVQAIGPNPRPQPGGCRMIRNARDHVHQRHPRSLIDAFRAQDHGLPSRKRLHSVDGLPSNLCDRIRRDRIMRLMNAG